MAEVTYTTVTWTTGDVITEAKLDNMVANDRAVDSMNNGVEFTERSDPSTPATNKLHLYAKDKAGASSLYFINDAGTVQQLSQNYRAFTWYVSASLATGTNYGPRYPVPEALTIVKVWLTARTAPTGQSILIDINKNGSTIWATQGNRGAITAGNTSGNTTTFDTTALSAGDYLDFDIDQVGSGTAGVDLTVLLECTQP